MKKFLFTFILISSRKSMCFFPDCEISHTYTNVKFYFIQSLSTTLQKQMKNTDFLYTSWYHNASQKYKQSNTCEISHAWSHEFNNTGTRNIWFWVKIFIYTKVMQAFTTLTLLLTTLSTFLYCWFKAGENLYLISLRVKNVLCPTWISRDILVANAKGGEKWNPR